MNTRSSKLAALLLLFLAPLTLRLLPIEHGLPRNYVPDTSVVRQALGMAKDKDLAPPVGRYSIYPNGISYMLLPIYATQYAVGRVTGEWAGAGQFGNHLKEHPETAHRSARYLMALLGALASVVVFRIGREVGLKHGAWIASWLTATSVMHLQFSTQERAWGPVVFFMALTLWPATRYAKTGSKRALLVAALCAAASASCHQSGLWSLGIVGLAWCFEGTAWRGVALRKRFVIGVSAVLLFAIVTLLVGYPSRLIHGATDAAVVGGAALNQTIDNSITLGGQKQVLGFRAETIGLMTRGFFGYDLVLCLLAPIALLRAFRRKSLRTCAAFALVWSAFYWTNPVFYVRYSLPMTIFFALPVGYLLEEVWSVKRARVLVLVALAFPLVMACRFAFVLSQPDTRALAELRLAELPEGALVGIDRHGPTPPLDEASLRLLERIRQTPIEQTVAGATTLKVEELRSREAHRMMYYDDGVGHKLEPGLSALPLEEILAFEKEEGTVRLRHFQGDPFGESVHDALRNLGVTHLLVVDHSPASEELGELPVIGLFGDIEPLWVIDPSSGSTPAAEARLPLEMSFPLTGLWSVERPGPKLSLYKLPAALERK